MEDNNSMKMEVASIKELIIVGCICVGLLFIALVVGATGPDQYIEWKTYASNCTGPSFTPCGGGVVLRHNETWSYELNKLTNLNRWWVLNVYPYVSQNDKYFQSGIETAVPMNVSLLAKNKEGDDYQLLGKSELRYFNTICFPFQEECFGFSVVDENYLRYPYYKVLISSPNVENGTSWMGDVKFDIWTMNPKFNKEVIIIRAVYAAVALLVTVIWYGNNLRRKIHTWTTEQKFTAVFLFSLFFMFNPFYFLEFTKIGWGFAFFNNILETQFISFFLLFCLIYLDILKIDRERTPQTNLQMLGVKIGIIVLHAILTFVLFIWNSVALENDAIVNEGNGIQIVYYLVSALYGGIIVWVTILCITLIPTIQNYPEIRIKFLFVIIPVSIIVASIALGVFTGTYGAYGRNAVSFYFFFSIYSVFVFLMAYGTWPMKSGFSSKPRNEATPLFNNNNTSPVEEENTLRNPFSNAQYFEEDTENYKKSSKKEEDYQPITNKVNDNLDDEHQRENN
eukprot:TRINITY_DN1625_c0_g1_i1.p1 TRINITY_DN1625_c0_g1~~TRINITY_DN1625_c0_g1_i1.p1  ORF type:complete len:509 (-),score=159.69 TRINITY_DN1625_c0_g1_i1:47-1573(-)